MTDTRFFVDFRGLANALGLTERWARAQTSKRALSRPDPIPHYKVGPRLVRFNIAQVLAWLNRTAHRGSRPKKEIKLVEPTG